MSDVISVLTFKSVATILRDGGSQSWALDRVRASRCEYVVVCRNGKNHGAEGSEEHGSAFLVGKVKDVVPSTETPGRWLIQISEYALVDWPEQWSGRNPVAYWNTNEYRGPDGEQYDFEDLDFQPISGLALGADAPTAMTIGEAKAGLAMSFGVPESAIEIVIRA